MSNIEVKLQNARLVINRRFGPDRIGELAQDPKKLVITPDFFVEKLNQFKNISNVVDIESFKNNKIVKENPVSLSAEKSTPKITEIPGSHNKMLDKLKNANMLIHAAVRRRRSGCRCPDKENKETPGCRSRFCAKKQKKVEIEKSQERRAREIRLIAGVSRVKRNYDAKNRESKAAS